VGAMNAQCFDFRVADAAGVSFAGAFAPWSIQPRRIAISLSLSRSPLGGMTATSPIAETALISLLSDDLPGTITAPESPPLSAKAAVSSRMPERCFSGPWQA